MTIEEIVKLSGLSQAAFARAYKIPIRTLQDWIAEKRHPGAYVPYLLERVVRYDIEQGSLPGFTPGEQDCTD